MKTIKQRVWIGLIWTAQVHKLQGFLFFFVSVLNEVFNYYMPEGYLTSYSFDYLTNGKEEKTLSIVTAWSMLFTVT